MTEELSCEELIVKIFFIIVIGILFEVGLFIFAYANADEVECNLLWCKFTSKESYSYEEINRYCSINGIEVNCSEIQDLYINIDDIINKTENPRIYTKDEWLE
jgi:hypothetical protein